MSVSQHSPSSSIDLSGLPPRVVEALNQMTAVCHRQLGSDCSAEAFEETERRVLEGVHALGCEVLGACAEARDDGALRIERDGQNWFRVEPTPKTIMTSLGRVTYQRARYRTGAQSPSLMPVDESLGLVDDYLTRPAAQLGLMMMGHCTAREAEAFFGKLGAMTPSASTLQRLSLTMQERWAGSAGKASARRPWRRSGKPTTSRRTRSPHRSRSMASWWRCGPARTAVARPAGARRPVVRSPSTTPKVSA